MTSKGRINNFVAILVATVVGFFLSFVWYTPFFGKAWAKEMGFDPNEKPLTPAFLKSLVLTAFSVFLMSLVLSNNMAAWTPSTWGAVNTKAVADLPKYAQALQAGFFT